MAKSQWIMKTDLKTLFLVADEKALYGVFLTQQKVPLLKNLDGKGADVKILKQTVRQLKEYFAGQRKDFDLPLAAEGTEFQKEVWKQLSQIPYGKTYSYKDIAKKVRKEKAFRAVGTANGKNPHCIIVPCHRVIAADGTLGGYGGGLKMKIKLLELENAFWKR